MTMPAAVALGAALLAGIVDARTGMIPDRISRTGTILAVALSAPGGALLTSCGGAVALGGVLLALHLLTGGRGLGLGDVKLGAAIGAGCGIAAGFAALAAAFIAGAAYGVALIALGRATRADAVRFGPFLAAGTATALFVCGIAP